MRNACLGLPGLGSGYSNVQISASFMLSRHGEPLPRQRASVLKHGIRMQAHCSIYDLQLLL